MNRISPEFKRLQESVADMARIGSREVKRTLDVAKRQLERMNLVQRRKELFAELGRAVYEAHHDGLPENIATFFNETELHEIITEIQNVDKELEKRQHST